MLKDERVAEEFANMLIGCRRGLGVLGDSAELWSAFMTTILDLAGWCLGTHPHAKRNFVSQAALDTIHQCRRGRLDGRTEQFRDLRCKSIHLLRADKEAYE